MVFFYALETPRAQQPGRFASLDKKKSPRDVSPSGSLTELSRSSICERHIEKAWAAYQVLMGANVPEKQPDPERDVRSLDARGTVYVIRVGDMIKIGWTSSPSTRMRDLKPDAILHYQAGSRRDEYKLQGRCMDYLVKGREWFDTSPAMIQFVKDLRLGKIAA